MVARLNTKNPQASEIAECESDSHTVTLPANSQLSGQNETASLAGCSAPLSPKPNALSPRASNKLSPANQQAADSPLLESSLGSQAPRAVPIAGAQMPKQGRLFEELRPFAVVDHADELLFPVRTKASFYEALKPITREKSFRAVARRKNEAPIIVCVERIREAFHKSGLTRKQIADLTGIKSRQTVSKILKVEPGIGFYDFCDVMNVLGLDIAEVFPMRKGKPAVPAMKWPRGYYHSIENMQHQIAVEAERKARRRKKRWSMG